jgi:hypothetical protein
MYIYVYIHIYIGVVQWSFSAMSVLSKDLSNAQKMLSDSDRSSPHLSIEAESRPSSTPAVFTYIHM